MSLIIIMSPVIITLSIAFTRLLHPLAMGLMLLLQTTIVCVTSGLSLNSFWFSYILFLIFLGAMLVLFMYVASLASNESFSFSVSMTTLIVMVLLTSVSLSFLDPITNNLSMYISQSSLSHSFMQSTPSLLAAIYNSSSMMLTLFIILYLLLTLIAVVKITNTFFGPLRLSS
uniref:NADH-ubiquinone oxidoreductase chain 6 n=1 Tax=Sicyonia parajaponica TaxID=2486369 RepID=A0A345WJ63_9EUCA|nr:NADH dehydrogenase subunit 6 [Sicyonia japonica]AXJ93106.1 NADH dehydrogenase subunit 6 [Sicyonia parajaponica]